MKSLAYPHKWITLPEARPALKLPTPVMFRNGMYSSLGTAVRSFTPASATVNLRKNSSVDHPEVRVNSSAEEQNAQHVQGPRLYS